MKTLFSTSLLQSRIARRMVGLFVLCALVPTSILGWVSYRQVTDQLMAQSSIRLQQESKSQGMVLYNHLLTLKADLDRLAGGLPQDEPVTEDSILTASVQELGPRFRELRLLRPDSPSHHQLNEKQVSHLKAGKTLLLFQPAANNLRDIVLARAVNPDRWEAGLLSASINETLLWDMQSRDMLPAETDLVVEDHDQRILYSTFQERIELPALQRQDLTTPMTEAFVWHSGERDYVAGAWTVPLRYIFLADPWIIALSQTRASALAPVDQFRHTFLMVIASALSVVVLLSLSHIRRSLQPVTLLQEGTTRLAGGDFTTHVTVNSGDEFEDLAASFNRMTGQLSRQFHVLETLSAISHAILSSHEPTAMTRLVQSRISETVACDAIGMALMESGQPGPTMMSVRHLHSRSKSEFTESLCQFSQTELDQLQRHPHHVLLSSSAPLPGYVTAMVPLQLASFAAFPIIVNHLVSGALVLAYRLGKSPSPDDIAAARRLADQVAVALANNRAIEARVRAQMELVGAVEAQHEAEERATVLQAENLSLETKEERLRHQQSATLNLVKDRTVFDGSLADAARLVTTTAAQALGVERTRVWIFEEGHRRLYCLDSYQRSTDRHGPEHTLSLSRYPDYFEKLQRGQVLTAPPASQDASFRELSAGVRAPRGVSSRMDAPFHTRTGLAGVVTVEHVGPPREWAVDEQQFAQALGNFMTLVLEAARRREAEEALAIAKLAAEDATKAKAEFLANMSHEIRTPMNGVIGMTEILARTSLSATQRHYVETIHNSGDTLLALINDILDFSKIEAGKLEIQPAPLDLRDLIERTTEQLAERAQRKGLQLLAEYDPSAPTAVIGDPIRIRQILTNLLGNAIKFTQQGDVRVHLTVDAPAPHEAGPAIVRIAVTDTGTGISSEGQARLFQSFSQVDGSSTRVHGGTGLGLSICKQLSQLMGGAIDVHSQMGQGSTFRVTLPLPLQTEPSAARVSDPALAGVRICAAVSHPATRQLLTQYLSSWGLAPRTADTGAEFLEQVMDGLATEGGQVIALIDETFADMTDLQVMQDLRSDSALADAGLLRLVSFTRRADVEQDPVFGGIPFVTKPLRYDALHAALLELLGRNPLPAALLPPAPPSKPHLAGTVLLGEDNPINQEIATLMLENLGCSVTVAQNGREVVDCVKTTRYDIIFMDCQMPDMDGFEATRLIRTWESELDSGPSRQPIPIIALTAHATPGDRAHCLTSGMSDYLSKPFTMEQLQQMVTAWLAQSTTAEIPAQIQSTQTADVPPADTEQAAPPTVDQAAWNSITALQRPGKPDMLAKILTIYLTDSQQLVDQVRQGVADGEAQRVNEAAHSLKSRSAVLGAVLLSDLCQQIEAISRQGSVKGTEPLLDPLETAFTHACQVFQAELEKRAA
ncbi:response regulator [Nitrospira lenta]|uniref:Sensory/regulatory protein RpfC n=1 Tax=Nitrospira lenta TaxID=1436998 RepID=A0A330L0D3_9BACT|nr:response regulator [Nitrospira lenta]SPP63251.1 putative Histidine kinase [Nitrospira lenta]